MQQLFSSTGYQRVNTHVATVYVTLLAILSEPHATDPLAADDDSGCALRSIFVHADGVPEGLLTSPRPQKNKAKINTGKQLVTTADSLSVIFQNYRCFMSQILICH